MAVIPPSINSLRLLRPRGRPAFPKQRLPRSSWRGALAAVIPRGFSREGVVLAHHIREGRFQRSLSLIAGLSGLLSGLEVVLEHYKGSYSQRIMYSPVIVSASMLAAGCAGALSRRLARTVLPVVSLITLVDGFVGFLFHVRGVARRPGGWRIPVFNVIMGPPIFAPLLFALAGYLGLLASLLRREDDPLHGRLMGVPRLQKGWLALLPRRSRRTGLILEQEVREGRFQRQLAAAAALSAFLSGIEALYAHYKNNFAYRVQWSPILLMPAIIAAGCGAIWSRAVARTLLPVVSALAVLTGAIGFFYHARGFLRRPGGLKLPLYNLLYGPPLFAPLLFAASGFLGLLASLLRRPD